MGNILVRLYAQQLLCKDILENDFVCVCPLIDHEFPHEIVKIAVDSRGESRVDPQTALTML